MISKLANIQIYPVIYGVANTIYIYILSLPYNNLFSYSITYCTIDIDECISGDHECNQNCNNTDGSYKCICEDGYVLDNDMKTCIGMCIII